MEADNVNMSLMSKLEETKAVSGQSGRYYRGVSWVWQLKWRDAAAKWSEGGHLIRSSRATEIE